MTSPYKLYYSAGACSMAVHVLLNELDQPVDLVKVDLSAPRDPEFLTVNPRGAVPVLVENGEALREGAAIMMHLCEKHNSDLLPASGTDRAKALEWLMFCNASLHPAYSRAFGALRMTLDAQVKDQLLSAAKDNIRKLLDICEMQLAETKYLAGGNMTVADILLTVITNWKLNNERIELGPNTLRLVREISARPAYQKALGEEGVEYRAVA